MQCAQPYMIFETSKTVFPGTYFGFDICNPKRFASKNRLSIVPSRQNLYFTYFLMIIMSKNNIFEEFRKSILTGAILCNKNALNDNLKSILSETFKNDEFLKMWILTCFTIFTIFIFFILGVGGIQAKPTGLQGWGIASPASRAPPLAPRRWSGNIQIKYAQS